jgi:hypothetical protein
METVKSFASLNFSDKMEPNRSGIIYESSPTYNATSRFKPKRVVMDSSSLSSANTNSFNNKEDDLDEEHVSIVPESPLGSPTKSGSNMDSYEKSFIDDEGANKESSDGSYVSAKDVENDPSIIAITPIGKIISQVFG